MRSGFWAGVAVISGIGLLLVLGSFAVDAEYRADCEEANWVVYSFEKCIADGAGLCLASPADIERYSRALTEINNNPVCERWVLVDDE